MDIIGRRFDNSSVEVDGNRFESCTFVRCRIIFSALDTVTFKDCIFDRCDWVFDGPAETTLTYLSALYRGLGPQGQELVEAVFQGIREGNVGGEIASLPVLSAR